MIRPTPRAVVLFAAGIPFSLALVLASDSLWLFGLAYLAAALFAMGIDSVLTAPQRILVSSVQGPDRLYIGDHEDVVVHVSIGGWQWNNVIEAVCDVAPGLLVSPATGGILRPGNDEELRFALKAERRGTFEVHRVWLRWEGPMGLVRRHRIHTLGEMVAVVPNVRAVARAAVNFSSWDVSFGVKPQKQQGEGSEFDALRDYLPGMDLRSVDWKHSARHLKLVCKEYKVERNHQIILAFDTGHLMREPMEGIPKLDHAINAGLLLGYCSLRSGDKVGMFAFDSQVRMFSKPSGGIGEFARLQHATADLAYHVEETNFTLGIADLIGRLNRRSLIVLLTDFVDTVTAELMIENLGRLASRHLIVFVTLQDPDLIAKMDRPPSDFEGVAQNVVADDFLRERALVFERLRRFGIHCIDAANDKIDAALLNRYIMIKRQELI